MRWTVRENRELIDALVAVAPVKRREAAAPMLRAIEQMVRERVDSDAGLTPTPSRPPRDAL